MLEFEFVSIFMLQVYNNFLKFSVVGKQSRTAMPLNILLWKNRLAKVQNLRRIHENGTHNFQFFWHRILTTLFNSISS